MKKFFCSFLVVLFLLSFWGNKFCYGIENIKGQQSPAEGQPQIHLNRYYHFTELMRDPDIILDVSRYRSSFDGTIQSILVLEPANGKSRKLFFFFHGMDGDCGDGVVVRDLVKTLDAKVVCIGGRGPSWVSDGFIYDAEKVIAKYINGFTGFYLIGISMGGTQVLTLAGVLSEETRSKILGVISFIPGTDLVMIAEKSSNQRVKDTLFSSVEGNMDKLKERSPSALLKKYKKNLPFVIFYNDNDTLLLTDEIVEFVNKLSKFFPVSIFVAPGEHNYTYEDVDYGKVFGELGKASMEKKALYRNNGRLKLLMQRCKKFFIRCVMLPVSHLVFMLKLALC